MLIKPYFEMAPEAGGGSSAEVFDYEKVASARDTIETAIETAIAAIKVGADSIESGFGSGGGAMSGGASNQISSKWGEMEDKIIAFGKLIGTELDKLGTVSSTNQSLEQQAAELFASFGSQE